MPRYIVEPLPTDQKIYLSIHERFTTAYGGVGNTPFVPNAVVIDTQAVRPQQRAVAVARKTDAERIAAALNDCTPDEEIVEGQWLKGLTLLKSHLQDNKS